jgi:hypothetical protein
MESHPTNGTGYGSNTLWTNSIPIHHPEENEFFAALRAAGDKLVHTALSHTDLSARYGMGSASLSYDGDHGAAYLLIVLLAFPPLADAKPDSFTPVTEFASGSVRAIPRATSEDESVAC